MTDQPQQQDLLLPPAGAVFFEPEREYTAAEVEDKHPELIKACLALLGQGAGVLRISKCLNMHPRTVMAVRRKYRENVEIEKKELCNLSKDAAQLCGERIMEKLATMNSEDMSLKDGTISFGILVEKSQLLSDQPTSRVEIMKASEDHQAYIDLVELPRQTGQEAERERQKGDVIRYGPATERVPGTNPGQVCEENPAPVAIQAPETPPQMVEKNDIEARNEADSKKA
ncbi:MAG: hypothetical protein WC552_10170 [Candidatus Omnitrophota bacterium]